MSADSTKKRTRMTLVLGAASALAFGTLYGVIARGDASNGTTAANIDPTSNQANVLTVAENDGNSYSVTYSDDEGESEGYEHEDDEEEVAAVTAAPTTAPTTAPTAAPTQAPVVHTQTKAS